MLRRPPRAVLRPARPLSLPPRPPRRVRGCGALLALIAILTISGSVWVQFNPDAVPLLVDIARATVGPRFVAQIETFVFSVQDQLRQANYHVTGTAPKLSWASPLVAGAPAAHSSGTTSAPVVALNAAPVPHGSAPVPAPTSMADASVAQQALNPPVGAASALTTTTTTSIAWVPYVDGANGTPLLDRAIVAPDPDRPYVEAALVRIDLTRTQLHLVAGTKEPISKVVATRTGTIPADILKSDTLLAAFNGGFKAANGYYGINVNGVTLLPPQDGLATLAFYRDGTVRLGTWGQEITATPDLVAYRQNCPLLLADGRPTTEAENPTTARWGKTVGNKVATWRSGLGLSADGRTLIYAVGDSLTVPALAEALRQGGAVQAMQLDINSFWTRFVTFTRGTANVLQAEKLLAGMKGGSRQFIDPDSRDFFYLTRQAAS